MAIFKADKAPDDHPVELLLGWKRQHEQWVELLLQEVIARAG